VDWKRPAHVVDRLIRACTPDPGAWTELDGARIKLGPVSQTDTAPSPSGPSFSGPGTGEVPDLAPGELLAARRTVFVGTGSRPLRLGEVQAPGKRLMAASDWVRGLRADGPVRFG
jgi:methionyl-tRNA formyltransferase